MPLGRDPLSASRPPQVLKGGSNPGPLTELEFWAAKAANLNAIHDQLNGPKIQKVMQILEVPARPAPDVVPASKLPPASCPADTSHALLCIRAAPRRGRPPR